MEADHGLRKYRAKPTEVPAVLRRTKASSEWVDWNVPGRRLAVAAVGLVMDTTAFGLFPIRKFLTFYGGVCALQNGITSDSLTTFFNARKKLKHASYQNAWRHLAENCQKVPHIFLYPIYRPRRAIQSCESEILTFQTVLEMLVKNHKLTTHFFRGSENVPFPSFWHKVAETECYKRRKFKENRIAQFWEQSTNRKAL